MKSVILLFALLMVSYQASSVPAMPGERVFKNDSGSSFIGKLKGNEWFHWIETKDGDVVIYNAKSKNYEYARIEQINGLDELVPSGVIASDQPRSLNSMNATSAAGVFDKPTDENIREINKRYQDKYSFGQFLIR